MVSIIIRRSSVSYNFVLHFFLAIYFFVATDIDNIFTQFIYKNVLLTKNTQQLITFLLISETLPNNNLFKTKTLKYQFMF